MLASQHNVPPPLGEQDAEAQTLASTSARLEAGWTVKTFSGKLARTLFRKFKAKHARLYKHRFGGPKYYTLHVLWIPKQDG